MSDHTPDGRMAWRVAGLLFFFSMINFLDKLVMGLAGVPIMREFGLSPSQYGTLASSFFFLYAISGLVVGVFLVQRMSPKLLLICLVLIWTVSQLPIIFGSSLLALYAGRVLLGVGEGPATPSAYHALYGWFTSERRNLPTSLLLAGIGTGFLVGSPLLTHIIADYGWRAAFAFCGIVGVVWVSAWAIFGADGPLLNHATGGSEAGDRVAWGRFWSDPTVVGNIAVASACYWVTGLSITWLAPYLQIGLGYSPAQTGWLVSVILGSQVVVQVGLSFLSHRLLLAGVDSRWSRGAVMGGSVAAAGVFMLLATVVDQPTIKVLLLAGAFTMTQIAFVIGPALVGEVAPAAQRGTALLVTYSVCTVTGLLSPIVTGWVVEAAGNAPIVGYTHALWLTGAIIIVGGLWGVAAINPRASRERLSRHDSRESVVTAAGRAVA